MARNRCGTVRQVPHRDGWWCVFSRSYASTTLTNCRFFGPLRSNFKNQSFLANKV